MSKGAGDSGPIWITGERSRRDLEDYLDAWTDAAYIGAKTVIHRGCCFAVMVWQVIWMSGRMPLI
jgi:riboflavin biosynthesis pyrimidine reductase